MSDYNFVDNNAQDIYDRLMSDLMAGCGPLYPGDERRIFGETEVDIFVLLYSKFNDQARQRFLRYARGVVLDYLGELLQVTRLQPAAAYATFRFTVSAVQTTNIIIPAGTRITSDGVIYFATNATAVLQAGQSYVDVEATCRSTGADYNNLPVGSIKTLVDLIPYIQDVQNITATVGGDDGEPYTTEGDNRFRNRIQLAPATRTTAGPEASYEYYALSADPDIIDVKIDCPKDQPCVVNIYTLMTDGALPDDEVLRKVEAACRQDDRRPMTDKVTALPPSQKDYDIEIKYYCTAATEPDVIATIEDDGGALDQYVEWQCAKLGRDINPDKLRSLVLVPGDGKTGPDRLDVIAPVFAAIGDKEVAHFSGKLTISHEVI